MQVGGVKYMRLAVIFASSAWPKDLVVVVVHRLIVETIISERAC